MGALGTASLGATRVPGTGRAVTGEAGLAQGAAPASIVQDSAAVKAAAGRYT